MECFTTEITDFFHIGKTISLMRKKERKNKKKSLPDYLFVYLQYGIASNFFVQISLDIAACSQTGWLNQSWESNACQISSMFTMIRNNMTQTLAACQYHPPPVYYTCTWDLSTLYVRFNSNLPFQFDSVLFKLNLSILLKIIHPK